jgi:hypothetical protein
MFIRPIVAISVALLPFITSTALAEDARNTPAAPAGPSTFPLRMTKCTVGLTEDYIHSLGPTAQKTIQLEGNKITGNFHGFEGDFAVIERTSDKQLVLIPKTAILYIIGQDAPYNL